MLDANTFRVFAYVDAQNAFGAEIRKRYTATVKYVGDDKWRAEDVTLVE